MSNDARCPDALLCSLEAAPLDDEPPRVEEG
jgi:hypothetical protein